MNAKQDESGGLFVGCDRHGSSYLLEDSDCCETAVNIKRLLPGTEVVIDTLNSRYHLVVIDRNDGSVLVYGGMLHDQIKRVQVEGSVSGGILLRASWITVGYSIGLREGDERIVTSPVRSIVVKQLHVS